MIQELTDGVNDIEKSVFKLTVYFRVAAILAAFFGISFTSPLVGLPFR